MVEKRVTGSVGGEGSDVEWGRTSYLYHVRPGSGVSFSDGREREDPEVLVRVVVIPLTPCVSNGICRLVSYFLFCPFSVGTGGVFFLSRHLV